MYQDKALQESSKKVEAARAENVKLNPRRMTAEEKDVLLKTFHPDYRDNQFTTLHIGANKGEKVPLEPAAPQPARPAERPVARPAVNPNFYQTMQAGEYRRQAAPRPSRLTMRAQRCCS